MNKETTDLLKQLAIQLNKKIEYIYAVYTDYLQTLIIKEIYAIVIEIIIISLSVYVFKNINKWTEKLDNYDRSPVLFSVKASVGILGIIALICLLFDTIPNLIELTTCPDKVILYEMVKLIK